MTITGLSKADHADRNHPRWRDRMQSVGVPRTDVEVRVVDDDDRDLPAGEVGEVVVRGDVVMAGYWHQPDATAEALRGGWLHTGDVGSFDDDGYLTLRDRSKDLIISGGHEHLPPRGRGGAAPPPRRAGPSPSSAGPTRSGARRWWPSWCAADGAAPPTVEDLDRTCLDHIARFKRPKDYRFVDALPTNNYGKVRQAGAARPAPGRSAEALRNHDQRSASWPVGDDLLRVRPTAGRARHRRSTSDAGATNQSHEEAVCS